MSAVDMQGISRRAAIVGLGATEFSKNSGRTELRLAMEATLAALADAGIDPAEVDGFSSYSVDKVPEYEIARLLGARDVSFFSQVPHGGGAACAPVLHAAISGSVVGSPSMVALRKPAAAVTIARMPRVVVRQLLFMSVLLPLLAAVAVSDVIRKSIQLALHLAKSDLKLADAMLDVLAVLADLDREAFNASLKPCHASRYGSDRAADRKRDACHLNNDRHPVSHSASDFEQGCR